MKQDKRNLTIISLAITALVCSFYRLHGITQQTPYEFVQEAIKAGIKKGNTALQHHEAYSFTFNSKTIETAPKEITAGQQVTLKNKLITGPKKFSHAQMIQLMYGKDKNGFRIQETADSFINLKPSKHADAAVLCIDNTYFSTKKSKNNNEPQLVKNLEIIKNLGGNKYHIATHENEMTYDGAMAIGTKEPELVNKSKCFVFLKKTE